MKKKLLFIMLVGCFSSVVFGGSLGTHSETKIESVENLINLSNSYQTNLVENLTDPCDNPPPPPNDNSATMTPPCVDLSDGDDESDEPVFGDSHKDALPFLVSQSYVARYHQEVPVNSGNYVFYEERPLISFEPGGKGFAIHLPNPHQVDGTYGYYRVDIVEAGAGGALITEGYVGIHYPSFEMPPLF